MATAAWLFEHLSDRDVAFLVHALVTHRKDHDRICAILRDKPDLVEIMLDDPRLYDCIREGGPAAAQVSPHMLYAVLIRQVRRDLDRVAHTNDYAAPGGRVPVFDAAELRAFLDDACRRDYLVGILASFTRTTPAEPLPGLVACDGADAAGAQRGGTGADVVGAQDGGRAAMRHAVEDAACAGGQVGRAAMDGQGADDDAGREASVDGVHGGSDAWEGAGTGLRRRHRWRFSELDLASLERIRPLLEERDHFAVDRRAGDLALFLAGACAHEHTRHFLLDAVAQAKVAPPSASFPEVLEALEAKARDAYRSAARHPIARATRTDGLLSAMAESVHAARKVLNHLSERHLDPIRDTWFQAPLLEAGR